MPSPFPGMDPYLEDPWLWPDVHHELISACRELLNVQLRPNYVARIEERVYVESEDDPARKEIYVVPDIRVAKQPAAKRKRVKVAAGRTTTEPIEVVFDPGLELHEGRIEVQATDTREVVAVIEILSPSNKVSGAEARDSFLKKRAEVLASPAHWVEIDLLRRGIGLPFRKRLDEHEYFAFVSHAERRPNGHGWPIRLTDPLPAIKIPLRRPDPDASLDLQKALALVYDRAAYDMTVDYSTDPAPPLPAPLAKWADTLLKKKKLR